MTAKERPDVLSLLPPERAALIDLLSGLDAAGWEAATECPAWTVKGIALHLLGDDLALLARQRDAIPSGLLLYAETHPGATFRQLLDGFNEQWVTAAGYLSPELIVELLVASGEWTAEFYQSVDPDDPGEAVPMFAAVGSSPYWQIIGREYLERWAHHHQIRRALDELDLGVEFLVGAADVIVASLATALTTVETEPEASVELKIDPVGSWSLRRMDDRWSATRAAVPTPDVGLTIDVSDATGVLSRGRPDAEVRSAFTAVGDDALAEAMLTLLGRVLGRP